MKTLFQRFLWFLLALGVGTGIAWEFITLPDASGRLDHLPLTGFDFASRDLPLNPNERAIFGEARVIKRLYQIGRQRVVVQIVDATRDRHAVHDPLFCFHGAGWQIRSRAEVPVPGGSAAQLLLHKGSDTTEAMIWFSDGVTRHTSAPQHWWQTILRRMTFGKSGAEPVLIILQPLSNESVNWEEIFARFPALLEI